MHSMIVFMPTVPLFMSSIEDFIGMNTTSQGYPHLSCWLDILR
jgi:hypothetical protein